MSSSGTLLIASCALLLACASDAARYETRGFVRARDGEGEDTRLAIQHEAIDAFRDRDGRRSPMPSMTMVFGIASGERDAGVQPGDKVRFAFDVQWDRVPVLLITKMRRLPADAGLELSREHDSPHEH